MMQKSGMEQDIKQFDKLSAAMKPQVQELSKLGQISDKVFTVTAKGWGWLRSIFGDNPIGLTIGGAIAGILGKGILTKLFTLLGPSGGAAIAGMGGVARVGGMALRAAPGIGAAAMVGKDVYDLATGEVTGGNIGGVAGGVIGGAVGLLGGPLGVALGATAGNYIGEQIGEWFDKRPEKGPTNSTEDYMAQATTTSVETNTQLANVVKTNEAMLHIAQQQFDYIKLADEEKMRLAKLGKPVSDAARKKIGDANRGRTAKRANCHVCGKNVAINILAQFHGDKCKYEHAT